MPLEEAMNLFVFFSLGKTTTQGEGKLKIQTSFYPHKDWPLGGIGQIQMNSYFKIFNISSSLIFSCIVLGIDFNQCSLPSYYLWKKTQVYLNFYSVVLFHKSNLTFSVRLVSFFIYMGYYRHSFQTNLYFLRDQNFYYSDSSKKTQ